MMSYLSFIIGFCLFFLDCMLLFSLVLVACSDQAMLTEQNGRIFLKGRELASPIKHTGLCVALGTVLLILKLFLLLSVSWFSIAIYDLSPLVFSFGAVLAMLVFSLGIGIRYGK